MPGYDSTSIRSRTRRNRQQAFTLLELLVVLVLVSIMMAVSVPRFRNTILSDPLKSSARQLIGMIREARQQAAVSEKGCFLTITIEERKFDLLCPKTPVGDEEVKKEDPVLDGSIVLSDEVEVSSVYNGSGTRFATGAVTLWVNPQGLMEPAIINLRSDDKEIGLDIAPFISEIRISDQHLQPSDDSEGAG